MKTEISSAHPLRHTTSALVLGCFEDDKDQLYHDCDSALEGLLGRLAQSREFTGKNGSAKVVHTLGKLPAERLVLVGLGKKKDMSAERLRQGAGNAVTALRGARVSSFSSALHLAVAAPEAAGNAALGMLLGSYSFEQYKTKEKEERFAFDTMTVLLPSDQEATGRQALERARIICDGVTLARDLVSHPGNVVTPAYLAQAARELAERNGLECRVYEQEELEQMGMNALIGVGKGAAVAPRLIVLQYRGGKGRPVALVGKGITFDSGGISIKPGAGMEAMKTDMAGSAAVLGTMEAAARLKLPVNLVGIIPTAENMPDGNAFKPGDILTSMSGTTIEITNTDAEGRLILCDALHFGRQQFKPAAMVDLATLTGACVVALGHEASGLMGNDQRLVDALKRAGDETGERVWPLPLWEEYGEVMKSDVADLKNAGSRDGGAISAGWFLKQFVGDTRWAHLDIAGTAWNDKARPYGPKGATGVGVRVLLEFLQAR
ncbi:leucyl aminopeptidase [Geomonas paludis]|uniref:Probable cytosol aminopeptidase n=1 Tax=Geomonas paludis TaxID=2740185 RepID=A0A6V8N0J1_9BACT|nr:leucyl aminopeptidase [Geomonas paludis]UPU34528.1 leucyl aminopeptidase [Geomonas paludis]GFO65985.1 putative cytosol aminopeptidase [Geomonas paludis]